MLGSSALLAAENDAWDQQRESHDDADNEGGFGRFGEALEPVGKPWKVTRTASNIVSYGLSSIFRGRYAVPKFDAVTGRDLAKAA